MRRKFSGLLLAVYLVIAPFVQAQGFWQKKEYQKWSQSECRQLLKDSPWAKSYAMGTVIFETVQQESTVAGRDATPQITYQAQIWSARPIRQAIVRQQQLDPKYTKLSPEQKNTLDEKSAKFIDTEFPDTVVVQVIYATTSQAYERELARYWQSTSSEDLKRSINLIGAAGRFAPLQVTVAPGAGREMQLIFPRLYKGEPMIGPNDKTLGLELPHPAIGVLPGERVYIPFDVKKMIIDGKVIF